MQHIDEHIDELCTLFSKIFKNDIDVFFTNNVVKIPIKSKLWETKYSRTNGQPYYYNPYTRKAVLDTPYDAYEGVIPLTDDEQSHQFKNAILPVILDCTKDILTRYIEDQDQVDLSNLKYIGVAAFMISLNIFLAYDYVNDTDYKISSKKLVTLVYENKLSFETINKQSISEKITLTNNYFWDIFKYTDYKGCEGVEKKYKEKEDNYDNMKDLLHLNISRELFRFNKPHKRSNPKK